MGSAFHGQQVLQDVHDPATHTLRTGGSTTVAGTATVFLAPGGSVTAFIAPGATIAVFLPSSSATVYLAGQKVFTQSTGNITGTGGGTVVNMTTFPCARLALFATSTGGLTSATISIDNSYDGTNFFKVSADAAITADMTIYVAVGDKPSNYMRYNVTAIVPNTGVLTASLIAMP